VKYSYGDRSSAYSVRRGTDALRGGRFLDSIGGALLPAETRSEDIARRGV
jgi:hypothetical protein